jgi:ABC-type branched-subunit amino acid transport system permease subunit
VVGAFLVVPLENWLRGAFGGLTPGAHLIVLGLLMVAASLFMKRGLVGAWQSLMRARRARSRP